MNMLYILKRIYRIYKKILKKIRFSTSSIRRYFFIPKFPVNENDAVYVNLGCGASTSKEFINIDTRRMSHIHYVSNVDDLKMFKDESVDLLYASHVLEHIERGKIKKVISEWFRVLKSGGILRIGVPDFDELIKVYYASGKNPESVVQQIMGGEGAYNDHHTLWNFPFLKKTLLSAGFLDVYKWELEEVKNHNFIDKTSRIIYLNGKRYKISLNVEAKK